MQKKKLKAEYTFFFPLTHSELRKTLQETQQNASAAEVERSVMLFSLNLEQYTCILRQKIILDYVSTRVCIGLYLHLDQPHDRGYPPINLQPVWVHSERPLRLSYCVYRPGNLREPRQHHNMEHLPSLYGGLGFRPREVPDDCKRLAG